MNTLRRITSSTIAVLLTAGLVVSTPSVASATREQCEHGANGFVDIPDDLSGALGDHRGNSVANLLLYFGNVQGRNRGWAKLAAAPGVRLAGGDLLWMDWSTNGGQTWMQCGPFPSTQGSWGYTTPAKETHWSYSFRAGALVNGELLLTKWI